ncbi:hypothetical protein SAMN06265784_10681 [Paraburkholderia susongensis]|uniref:Uncharacterized protein n=1 Tax=Paraburkholderia susongensis TaxID=1515439 RepID=A0A1X7LIA9_9BURK|nr:hypothetical protein SAMN06265784_10681 [Paraburkholderia susongensis]
MLWILQMQWQIRKMPRAPSSAAANAFYRSDPDQMLRCACKASASALSCVDVPCHTTVPFDIT